MHRAAPASTIANGWRTVTGRCMQLPDPALTRRPSQLRIPGIP